MLSTTFDIPQFLDKVKKRSHEDIILLANQEATAAERYVVKHLQTGCGNEKKDSAKALPQIRSYVLFLKDLILYLRHGILTRNVRSLNLNLPRRFKKTG